MKKINALYLIKQPLIFQGSVLLLMLQCNINDQPAVGLHSVLDALTVQLENFDHSVG